WTAHGVMLPGLGQDIENIATTTNQDWVSTVEHRIDEMATTYQSIWVLGYSLGGAIALQAVQGKPIEGLVLIAPFWKIDSVT
ncbi:MAG: alpha/beta fold hydrolase, partial [Gammaproteobacteria bacterium]|nr:alpha/beta fold hydrolase [Gammaproteobacteria bacterium]